MNTTPDNRPESLPLLEAQARRYEQQAADYEAIIAEVEQVAQQLLEQGWAAEGIEEALKGQRQNAQAQAQSLRRLAEETRQHHRGNMTPEQRKAWEEQQERERMEEL